MSVFTRFLELSGIRKKHVGKPKNKAVKGGVLDPAKKGRTPVSSVFTKKRDVKFWKKRIDEALNPPYFNRYDLYQMYKEVSFDLHLSSQITTRINGTLSEEYVIKKDGVVNEELTEQMQKVWMQEVIEAILKSVYWGVCGVEVSEVDTDGRIAKVKYIESEYFSLERNAFIPNPDQASITVELKRPLTNWLLVFGRSKDLGLLSKASRLVIYKNLSIADWARHSEVFGSPYLIIFTDESNEEELEKIDEMGQSFRGAGYTRLPWGDEAKLLEQKATNPHVIYEKMIAFCDAQISKLISGQTGTSDEKTHVGSANVHERVLNMYVLKDMRFVKNTMNEQVIPFLVEKGYSELEGCSFDFRYFNDLRNKPKEEKKTQSSVDSRNNLTHELNHENFYKGCC